MDEIKALSSSSSSSSSLYMYVCMYIYVSWKNCKIKPFTQSQTKLTKLLRHSRINENFDYGNHLVIQNKLRLRDHHFKLRLLLTGPKKLIS